MPPSQPATTATTKGKKRGALYVACALITVVVVLAHIPQLTRWFLGHDDPGGAGGDEGCFGIFCVFSLRSTSIATDADDGGGGGGGGGHDHVGSPSPSSSSSSSSSSPSSAGASGRAGGESDDAFSPERVEAVAKLMQSVGKEYCSGAPTPWLPMPVHTHAATGEGGVGSGGGGDGSSGDGGRGGGGGGAKGTGGVSSLGQRATWERERERGITGQSKIPWQCAKGVALPKRRGQTNRDHRVRCDEDTHAPRFTPPPPCLVCLVGPSFVTV